MANIARAFQIFDGEAARATLDPDFEPLDDSAAERPDWQEYWPISRYLASHELDATTYYGFLSARSFAGTGLRGRQVLDFAAGAGDADVVTFSPHPGRAAFYNVFEHAANFFPGFLELATDFLRLIDPDFRLQGLVNDSRNTVYGNCFLARPRFWREWQGLFQRVFEAAEAPDSPLREALNRPHMKGLLMERVPSLLLSSRAFATRNYLPLSAPEFLTLDALKIAYADTGTEAFLQQFVARRGPVLEAALAAPAS